MPPRQKVTSAGRSSCRRLLSSTGDASTGCHYAADGSCGVMLARPTLDLAPKHREGARAWCSGCSVFGETWHSGLPSISPRSPHCTPRFPHRGEDIVAVAILVPLGPLVSFRSSSRTAPLVDHKRSLAVQGCPPKPMRFPTLDWKSQTRILLLKCTQPCTWRLLCLTIDHVDSVSDHHSRFRGLPC